MRRTISTTRPRRSNPIRPIIKPPKTRIGARKFSSALDFSTNEAAGQSWWSAFVSIPVYLATDLLMHDHGGPLTIGLTNICDHSTRCYAMRVAAGAIDPSQSRSVYQSGFETKSRLAGTKMFNREADRIGGKALRAFSENPLGQSHHSRLYGQVESPQLEINRH